jgi:hypothetical protein
MTDPTYLLVLTVPALRAWASVRLARDDRGEGVISTAIAVLVVAFLGALMWVGFKQLWSTTKDKTDQQITQIGN